MNNCIQFVGDGNIKCEDFKYTNFDSFQKFNNNDFRNIINENYNFPGNPYLFPENYKNLPIEEGYTLQRQQKFVSKYANMHNNFGGGTLVYHFLGSGKTCTSILVGEAYKAYKKKMTEGFQFDEKIIVVLPLAVKEQFKAELINRSKKEQFQDCVGGVEYYNYTDNKYERLEYYDYNNSQESLQADAKKNFQTAMKLKKEELNKEIKCLKGKIAKQIQEKNELEKNSKRYKQKINNIKKIKKKIKNLNNTINTTKKYEETEETKFTRQMRNEEGAGLINKRYDKEISKWWDITTYGKFINGLINPRRKTQTRNNEFLREYTKQLQKGGQVVIIDEIQNLVSEIGSSYKKLINIIRLFSHNNRFILLSATPIYDKPFEIGLTLNLLKPRLFFPLDRKKFNNIFTKKNENSYNMKNKELFYWMCNGYVSYFSGGNPKYFPYKRVIEMHHPMKDNQLFVYFKMLYKEVRGINDILDDKTKIETDENSNKNYLTRSRALCNIVFNNESINMKNEDRLKYLFSDAYKYINTSNYVNLFDYLKKFSSKMTGVTEKILQLNEKEKGTSLIFSDLYWYGVKAMSVFLDLIGYQEVEFDDLPNENLSEKEILKQFEKNMEKKWKKNGK